MLRQQMPATLGTYSFSSTCFVHFAGFSLLNPSQTSLIEASTFFVPVTPQSEYFYHEYGVAHLKSSNSKL